MKEWLKREGTCLLVAPHHDVGFTDDADQRQMEYKHHGDRLVPRQQRFSEYTRSLMKALDIPVWNEWGLRPALVKGTRDIAPLTAFRDLDKLNLLNNVPTLNFHPHLPHYVLTKDNGKVQVLARQPIDPDRPHPFTAAGNTEFNCLLWMPPSGERAGDIVLGGAKFSTISLQYDPTFHLNSSETEILLRMTVPIVRRHAGIHDPQTAIRKVITLTAFTTVRGADFSFRGVRPCAASQASMRKPRTTLGEKEERRG
jgi:hypothetical protein